MWVGEIDVHDDDLVRAWWQTADEGDSHGRPYRTYWSLWSATIAFRADNNSVEQHPVAAIDGDEVLGTNQVIFPILDNTHVAYAEPIVRPGSRRRGVGTALLDHSLEMAKAAGRSTVIIEVNLPWGGAPAPGVAFLERRGFERGMLEIHRVLDLPVAAERLEELAAAAAPLHADYRFATWEDTVPEEYLDGFCSLQSSFNTLAPIGDLDIEPEVWDEARVRNIEARSRKQGRRETATAAVAPDDSLVALTMMMTTDDEPQRAFQGGTLVLPEHRGHRLGLAAKVINLERFQHRFPQGGTVHSWNAEENGPMVAINDTLGFRPVEYLAEMQLKL
jgi:GNAT superfamily N-acetyltransferase